MASQHEADHGQADEGCGFAGVALVVSGEPAAAADPSEGALDDPALREDDEAVPVAAADDLKLPEASAGDGGFHLLPLVAGIVAGRIKRSPPLRAPFAVWLSMIAVVGLASRPAFSRTST